ncbi:hypothetical protein ACFL0H_15040 [Thermodesulfobacteriota bacterium]
MKKFYLIVLAAILCLTLAMPAMAKVRVGGIVVFDAVWTNWDQDFMRNKTTLYGPPNLDSEVDRFHMDNTFGNRLFVKFTGPKGNVGGHMEWRLLSEGTFTKNAASLQEGLQTAFAYGWWQINPTFKLTAGQQNELISGLDTYNYNGSDVWAAAAHGGFGNIGQNRIPGVRLDAKITDSVTLSVAASELLTRGGLNKSVPPPPFTSIWGTNEEDSSMPRFDIQVAFKLGPITFLPSYMSHTIEWKRDLNSAAASVGWDTEVDTWAFSIPAKASFGPFNFAAEYNTGENLEDSNIGAGGASGAPMALNTVFDMAGAAEWGVAAPAVIGKVYDTDYDGWWAYVEYKFSRAVSAKFLYGEEQVENNMPGSEFKYDRDGIMLSLSWVPAPVFKITPFYGIYDLGTMNGVGSPKPGLEFGEVTQVGVNFFIVF